MLLNDLVVTDLAKNVHLSLKLRGFLTPFMLLATEHRAEGNTDPYALEVYHSYGLNLPAWPITHWHEFVALPACGH